MVLGVSNDGRWRPVKSCLNIDCSMRFESEAAETLDWAVAHAITLHCHPTVHYQLQSSTEHFLFACNSSVSSRHLMEFYPRSLLHCWASRKRYGTLHSKSVNEERALLSRKHFTSHFNSLYQSNTKLFCCKLDHEILIGALLLLEIWRRRSDVSYKSFNMLLEVIMFMKSCSLLWSYRNYVQYCEHL